MRCARTSRRTCTTSKRVPRHDASRILPVTSISSALSSSSPASPLSCARSMSCNTCCTLNLQSNKFQQFDSGIEREKNSTHALPITPHASFATDPFSFNLDQNPGLNTKKKRMEGLNFQRKRGSIPARREGILLLLTFPRTFCSSKSRSPW